MKNVEMRCRSRSRFVPRWMVVALLCSEQSIGLIDAFTSPQTRRWHRRNLWVIPSSSSSSPDESLSPSDVFGDRDTGANSKRHDRFQNRRGRIETSGTGRQIYIPKDQIPQQQDEPDQSSSYEQREQPFRHFNSYRNDNNKIQTQYRKSNENNDQQLPREGRKFSRRSFQNSNRRRTPVQTLTRERHGYLVRTTNSLLDAPHGSLVDGKQHELVSMFRAWSNYAKETSQAPQFMEKIIQKILKEIEAGNNNGISVNIGMYNMLLDAWACVALFVPPRGQGGPQPAQRAREILVLIQAAYEAEDSGPAVVPNEKSFEIVFHAVCKTEGPIKARRILAWMEYLAYKRDYAYAKPTQKQYFMLLNAYGNSREAKAGHLAQAFLRHMHSIGVEPSTLCYNIAIKAWAKTRRGRESAEHAEQILEEMKAPKDSFTYGTVISAWAASGMRSHAVSRAEKLLRAMEEVDGLEANTVVLNTVMSTWVKSKSVGAVNRTEAMLRRMEESPSMQPDLISYNTHLHALSMHSAFSADYALKAHALLLDLETRVAAGEISFSPNLFSYNLIIEAFSKSRCPNAAFRAVETLRSLIQHQSLEPDTFSFNCAITALSRSKSSNAAQVAEELLIYMEDAYKNKVHRKVRPDVVSYTTTIVAISRSSVPDAPERAEAILERMKDKHASGISPNTVTYNSVIEAWAKSGRGTFAARRAEAVLREMEEMRAMGDDSVSPNRITYNSLMNSWARSGTLCCANKAESYLNRMWELYNGGEVDLKPDDLSFNTVINAISKSQHRSKAQKALRVLRRMDKLYQSGYIEAKPCTVSYTSVIKSCAFPASYDEQTRRKALDTAIFTFEELRTSGYGRPNQITYTTFIKACTNLLSTNDDDDLRRSVIEKTFQDCCTDGLVSDLVLTHLRDAAPADLYQRLLADAVIRSDGDDDDDTDDALWEISAHDLPSEWRCNLQI